jgi:uncharacterized protein (TIGR03663 family)
MRWWLAAGLILAVVVALRIDERPLHTDEAVHTIKFRGLWDAGVYRYDPHEYHGPSLYYATWAVARAAGAPRFADTEIGLYRLVPVLFGVGLILLLPLLGDGLGRGAVFWGGVFTAVSPAMVFYSRYYIHEMLLVFFTLLLLVALWRRFQGGGMVWCAVAGVAVGLMQATKETFVLALAALALAVLATRVWNRFVVPAGSAAAPLPVAWRWPCGLLAVGLALLVSVTLFTAFFTHWRGAVDAWATYAPWFRRAEGQSPHVHPWYYYLGLLIYTRRGAGPVWSEAMLLVLAVVGWVAMLIRRDLSGLSVTLPRFLGFYTAALAAIYALIPYKTPWCLLGFLSGVILLAGVGAVVLLHAMGRRGWQAVGVVVLLVGSGHLAGEAWRASVAYADSQRNPYVYAQSLRDVEELAAKVDELAALHPDGRSMVVQVAGAGGDYWPLPWYLRRFNRVGWWDGPPEFDRSAVVIASPALAAKLGPGLEATHENVGYFGLRPGVFLQLFVEKQLWEKHLKARQGGLTATGAR